MAEDKNLIEVPKEFEKIVAELDKMTSLEISKFVHFLEEYFSLFSYFLFSF